MQVQCSNSKPSEMDLKEQIEKIQSQNEQILDILQKKKKTKKVDENEERGNWSGQLDFFLSCLGYAVGLGNVWRFPYMCYKNGGGAFLIPYVIMLVFLGMPIFFLELSLGQFTSRGPFSCWGFCSLFSGIGYAMFIVSAVIGIYYNVIIAWAIYYMFDSFRAELPWAKCDPAWASPYCMDFIPILSKEDCENHYNHTNITTGICTNGTSMAIFDEQAAKAFGVVRKLPSAEYLERHVLHSAFSDGILNLGPVQTPLALCYLVAFILVALCLSKSIKSSGKVVYFTATFPYLVLLILLIRGLTLDGSEKGIEFYTTPDISRLADSTVWKQAAEQIFFTLSASYGGLVALSSYNRFHTNALRDTLSVTLANCLTSVFAGFVVFSFLGNLAHDMGVSVDDVVEKGGGITLAFVVYPYAVTQMPGAQFWAILFFFMLITLGVDSEFVVVETVMTCLADRFQKLREHTKIAISVLCLVMFLLGLPLVTNGGIYWLTMLDSFAAGWNVLIIAVCECISVSYLYGVRRFAMDIECMIGKRVLWDVVPWSVVKYWWMACWSVFTPVGVVFILIYSWVDYKSLSAGGMSVSADVLGWMLTLTVIFSIIGKAVYLILKTSGTFKERIKKLTSPVENWGPALPKHREFWEQYKESEMELLEKASLDVENQAFETELVPNQEPAKL
ncbi:hypothetical protein ScPMuIL_018406 [Solemya velum]